MIFMSQFGRTGKQKYCTGCGTRIQNTSEYMCYDCKKRLRKLPNDLRFNKQGFLEPILRRSKKDRDFV